MVIIGGLGSIFGSFAAIIMRYKWLPQELRPSRAFDLALWLSIVAIVAAGIVSAVKYFVV